MTNFRLTPAAVPQIRVALSTINATYSYSPIWYLSKEDTISKEKTEGSIPMPTTLQISDIVKALCDSANPYEIAHYTAYMTQAAHWFSAATLVEVQLLALALLIDNIGYFVEERGDIVDEDPFTKE